MRVQLGLGASGCGLAVGWGCCELVFWCMG